MKTSLMHPSATQKRMNLIWSQCRCKLCLIGAAFCVSQDKKASCNSVLFCLIVCSEAPNPSSVLCMSVTALTKKPSSIVMLFLSSRAPQVRLQASVQVSVDFHYWASRNKTSIKRNHLVCCLNFLFFCQTILLPFVRVRPKCWIALDRNRGLRATVAQATYSIA